MFDEEQYENLRRGVVFWNAWVQVQGPGFKAKLQGADLTDLGLHGAILTGANLDEALLINCRLDNANLRGASLQGAQATGASLERAILKNANLREINLHTANLANAILTKADITSADLQQANLFKTRVDGATLTNAKVKTAAIISLRFDKNARPLFVDLSDVLGLGQTQLNSMLGDSGTRLPERLERPAHWPSLPGLMNGKHLGDARRVISSMGADPKADTYTPPGEGLRNTTEPIRLAHFGLADLYPDMKYPGITGLSKPTSDTTPVNPDLPGPETQTDPDRFVFLSYKREDRPWVATLRGALMDRGIPIWWDDDIPFDRNWDDEIDAHLERAAIVLTLWTDKSVASREVRNEALFAMRNDKLVQARTGDPKLGPRYASIQCADLTEWAADAQHADFDRLVDTLHRRLGD